MYGQMVPIGGGDNIPLRKEELIIGRKEECDIVLRFGNVSSRHCRLVLSSGYWYIQDLKSTNGVKVNGFRVDDRRVDPGAKLTIAHHDYRLDYDPQALGAGGAVPPDVLESDIMDKGLLERAGLEGKARRSGSGDDMDTSRKKNVATEKDGGIERIDYSMFSIDDIKMTK